MHNIYLISVEFITVLRRLGMKVIVDAMGGDNAPNEIIRGSIEAIKELGVEIILVGKKDIIQDEIKKNNFDNSSIEIINAEDIITNEEEPAMAIRRKKDSSTVVGLNMLKDGLGDAFISAGSTGALLAGGLLIVKRIKGIERAALATVFPTKKRVSLLLDVGANADCKAKYIQQFGLMGSIYSEKVLNVKSPKVGLVNIGTEKEKGSILAKEAYDLLSASNINFYGNIEARDIPEGNVDVIVCDGFVGNVIVKLTEGLAKSIFSELKDMFTKSFFSKLGALMLKSQLKEFKKNFDYREYGGAPLLGIQKPVIKAHGSSDSTAIKNAIRQAKVFIENDVINIIEEEIGKIEYNE